MIATNTANILIFTVCNVLFCVAMTVTLDLPVARLASMFFGLEGTIFLGTAISPPTEHVELPQGNWWQRIVWHFGEGDSWRYPMNYNPVCFKLGLVLVAVSLAISAAR